MRNFGYFEEGHTVTIPERTLWLRTIKLLKMFRLPFFCAVLLSLLVTGSGLALPWLMQQGIDLYITDSSNPIDVRMAGLGRIVLWYGAFISLNFITAFTQVLLLEWIGQSVMHNLRQKLFSHLLSLHLEFFTKQPVGRLVTRITNDIQNMHEMFTSIMVTLFNDLLKMTCIIVLLIFLNPQLGSLLCLFVPLAGIITYFFSKLARNHFRSIRKQLAKLNSFIQETVSGIYLVQIFGQRKKLENDFAILSDSYLEKTVRQIKLFGTFMPLTELMSSLATALILWYGGGELIQQHLTLGELVAFLSYMRLFFQPLRELSQKYSIVQSALASAERIFHLLDTKSTEIDEPQDLKQQHSLRGNLCFQDVCFSYEANQPVLQDISFTIQEGETVAIVGPTGSGKSTLINLLFKFYQADTGTISLGKQTLREISTNRLRQKVGVVMQEMLILQDSLLNNIRLDTGKSEQEIEELIHQAQLSGFLEKLPDGLHTIIGEGGRSMSTGEKQLLAICRVLCRDPSLLVLDEASSAIDSRTEELLEQTLETCFQGKTVLIIAHRLSTVQRADRIIVLDKGKIYEQGSHAELLAKKGLYSKLLALDFG
jgi:ATP-binding cassette, subfamily B, multidrug efflux pump